MALTTAEEIQALRREVEGLRAQRSLAASAPAAREATTAATDNEATASPHNENDWAEIKQQITDIAHEFEEAARERPLFGIVSAFVAGLLCSRLFSK